MFRRDPHSLTHTHTHTPSPLGLLSLDRGPFPPCPSSYTLLSTASSSHPPHFCAFLLLPLVLLSAAIHLVQDHRPIAILGMSPSLLRLSPSLPSSARTLPSRHAADRITRGLVPPRSSCFSSESSWFLSHKAEHRCPAFSSPAAIRRTRRSAAGSCCPIAPFSLFLPPHPFALPKH